MTLRERQQNELRRAAHCIYCGRQLAKVWNVTCFAHRYLIRLDPHYQESQGPPHHLTVTARRPLTKGA